MKVQKYRFMVFNAAARWVLIILCYSSYLAAAAEAAAISDRHEISDLRYQTVRFTITSETTGDDYAKFIKDIINHLETGFLSNDIRLLAEPRTLPISHSNRFLLVELGTRFVDESVTLAIDRVNAYVVAYRGGEYSFFFRDAPEEANEHLFLGTNNRTLRYGGGYLDLEGQAGAQRSEIQLGREALIRAVTSLRYLNGDVAQSRSLMVVIQMICEAVRYRDIFWAVRQSLGTSGVPFLPNTYMLSLQNSWGQQSRRVQESGDGGVFNTPIDLEVAPGTFRTLSNVRDVVASLGLLLYACRRDRLMSLHDDQNKFRHPDLPLLIKSVVESDDTCSNSEPTVRISGRDGLCVDVREGLYRNGNPIQLWTCETNEDPKQLWTIRSDGTIRSNGMCMTTYGYAAGNYVMIFDCSAAVAAATRWQIFDNGTIVNPQSALVLGAGCRGSRGTTLTVQTNVHASQQGWFASNDTRPREVTIVGLSDLCMQENGLAPRLENCDRGKQEQIWTLYSDRTIRPKQNQGRCLTCLSDSPSTLVTIGDCSSGSSGQRWVFTNDGTILNLHNEMVMDVRGSNPSLGEIIIYQSTGNRNQEWLPLPA